MLMNKCRHLIHGHHSGCRAWMFFVVKMADYPCCREIFLKGQMQKMPGLLRTAVSGDQIRICCMQKRCLLHDINEFRGMRSLLVRVFILEILKCAEKVAFDEFYLVVAVHAFEREIPKMLYLRGHYPIDFLGIIVVYMTFYHILSIACFLLQSNCILAPQFPTISLYSPVMVIACLSPGSESQLKQITSSCTGMLASPWINGVRRIKS